MKVVFVHGACVRDGSWWWHRTGDLLAQRGVRSATPALPSCGESGSAVGTRGAGLPDDIAVVQLLRKTLSSFGDETPAPFLDIDPDGGTFGVRPELLVDTFLQDCDRDAQTQAMTRLARQSLHVIQHPVQAAAWQQLP